MGRRFGLVSIRPPRILVTKYIFFPMWESRHLKIAINDYLQQSSFWEAWEVYQLFKKFSAFYGTIVFIHIFKPSPFFPILIEVNPLLILPSYCCQFHFNSMISFTSRSYNFFLSFSFSITAILKLSLCEWSLTDLCFLDLPLKWFQNITKSSV